MLFGAPAPHPPRSPTRGRHSGQLLCRQGYGRAIQQPRRQKRCCGAARYGSAGIDPDPQGTTQAPQNEPGRDPRTRQTLHPAAPLNTRRETALTPLASVALATPNRRLPARGANAQAARRAGDQGQRRVLGSRPD